MKTAAIDFETYYDDTFGITIQGTRNYIFDSRFDAYMVTIKTDTGIEYAGPPILFDWSKISSEGWQWIHHNASFDELVIQRLRKDGIIPLTATPEVTHCTADLCAYLGGPRNLAGASKFFLHEEVSKDTRTAMKGQKWSSMTPEFREEVTKYAMRDAELTLELWQKLSDQWPNFERMISRHTRAIAWDGIPIDVAQLDKAIPELERRNWEAGTRIPWYHDGEEKPLSPKALAEQCRKVGIEPPPSLAKDSVDCAAWEDKYGDTYPWVAAMREYRRTNTLLERLKAMRARVTPAGDMNFGLLYFGASVTGRWAGADGVNVQNLPAKPMFGVDFRSLLKAPPGYVFINADLSQIEPRCLAWLVGNEALMQKLREGMAIYEAHARTSMGWTGGKLKNEDPHLYALAKARVLSLGYGAGAEKFVMMAATYGVKLDLVEAEAVVSSFRASEPLVCGRNGLWNQLQLGMTKAASKREDYRIELPSGRLLRYMRPSTLGGLTAETVSGRGILRKKWWGGSLTENCLSGETQVLSATRGWVRLDSVLGHEKVWDGDDFVSHAGLACRGEQKVIQIEGVQATPDHEFLTDHGWVPAGRACTLKSKVVSTLDEEVHKTLRAPLLGGEDHRQPESNRSSSLRGEEYLVDREVFLRVDNSEAGKGAVEEDAEKQPRLVRSRVPKMEGASEETEDYPRDVSTPCLLCLEVDERSVPLADAPRMEKLRRERNQCVPALESLFPSVLGDNGANMGAETAARPHRQLERVFTGELSVGGSSGELPEQALQYQPSRVAEGLPDSYGCRTVESEHGLLSSEASLELGQDAGGVTVPVFDILNCGPNHRFAVRAGEGFPVLIAHNCVQATARDVFASFIPIIEYELGLPILFHVHDELTCLIKEDKAEDALRDLLQVMRTPPEFMPGLPLDAEGKIVTTYPNK
jgi:hypothetical protein